MSEHPRITIIVRDENRPELDWRRSGGGSPIFSESIALLRYMLQHGMRAIDLDVERFVIDRAATDTEFLELLAGLPADFTGDALHVRCDGSGFLSAAGRGDGRHLYALDGTDVRFYLEAHDLVTGHVALRQRMIA